MDDLSLPDRPAEPRTRPGGESIVTADYDDTAVLGQVIADAFHCLPVCRFWLVPSGADRKAILPRYFELYVRDALAGGRVDTTADRSAAALWIVRTGPSGPDKHREKELAEITGPYLGRFTAFEQQLGRHHPAGVFHHHLAILAVSPDAQDRGIGSALLAAHHTRLDRQGIPASLVASDGRTRGLYRRHGYTDRDPPIELADGVLMYPMWRDPYPRDAAG